MTAFGIEFLGMQCQKSAAPFFHTRNQISNMLFSLEFIFSFLVRIHWAFWFGFRCSEPARKLKAYRKSNHAANAANSPNKSFPFMIVFVCVCFWVCVCWATSMHTNVCVCVRGGHKTEISCNWSLRFAFAFWFCCGRIGQTVVMQRHVLVPHGRCFPFFGSFVSGLAWSEGKTIWNITY